MELSVKRLECCSLTIQGDMASFEFYDSSYNGNTLALRRGARDGDYVVLLMIRDVNGVGHKEIYRIETKFMIRLTRRSALAKALDTILAPYGAMTVELGLYYHENGQAKISNIECPEAKSMLFNLTGNTIVKPEILNNIPNELADEVAIALATKVPSDAITLIVTVMAKMNVNGFLADIPTMQQTVKDNLVATSVFLGREILFQVDK